MRAGGFGDTMGARNRRLGGGDLSAAAFGSGLRVHHSRSNIHTFSRIALHGAK
jgi:hypothetical protein